MSKLLIAQLVFVAVLVIALLAEGMQIFGLGKIDPDVLLPWAYTAAVGWVGAWGCLAARLCVKYKKHQRSERK